MRANRRSLSRALWAWLLAALALSGALEIHPAGEALEGGAGGRTLAEPATAHAVTSTHVEAAFEREVPPLPGLPPALADAWPPPRRRGRPRPEVGLALLASAARLFRDGRFRDGLAAAASGREVVALVAQGEASRPVAIERPG